MTSQEIIKLLPTDERMLDEYLSNEDTYHSILGNLKTVDSYGGAEGDGEYCYVVIQCEIDGKNRFFKIEGNYYSFNGIDFGNSSWEEVCPQKKVIIEYVPISVEKPMESFLPINKLFK